MAQNASNLYIQPEIPGTSVCNEIVPASVIIAPRVRCALLKDHKDSNHVGTGGDYKVSWRYGWAGNYKYVENSMIEPADPRLRGGPLYLRISVG